MSTSESSCCGGEQAFQPPSYNRMMLHLHFTDAAKAIDWYKSVLGATERKRFATDDKKHIMHAELQVGDTVMMLSDVPAGAEHGPANASIYLYAPQPDALYAAALSNGASGNVAPHDTFYGERMASFRDPFGNQWMVARPLVKKAGELPNIVAEAASKAEADSKSGSGDLLHWKKMNEVHFHKVADRKPGKVVSGDDWFSALQHHLSAEKALTHHSDYVTSLRQQLPWTEIRGDYLVEDLRGHTFQLVDLFANPQQDDLIVYHMMQSDSDPRACSWCSYWIDQINGMAGVLQQKVNLAVIAKAAPPIIAAHANNRGWTLPLFSAHKSTFAEDMGFTVTEAQYQEFKALADKLGGNEALKQLKRTNPKHPNAAYNFGVGCPDAMTQLSGFTILHLDRKTNKVYRTFQLAGRGRDTVNAGNSLLDLLPYGREGYTASSKESWKPVPLPIPRAAAGKPL